MRASLADGVRLAVGTLTAFPVPAPRVVDRRSASWAMTLAPLVGALLALPPLLVLGLADRTAPLVGGALTIALLAVLTRAMHLDGLADTADGLGSGKPSGEALAIMRKGDIGPFGVVALVLVLAIQVTALGQLVVDGDAPFAIALALVVSRLMLPLVCLRGVLAARSDGLGHVVAGSVGPGQAALATVLALSAVAVFAVAFPGADLASLATEALLTTLVALLAGVTLCGWAVRRLGGVTGDVLGACVEVTFTAVLVVLVFA